MSPLRIRGTRVKTFFRQHHLFKMNHMLHTQSVLIGIFATGTVEVF